MHITQDGDTVTIVATKAEAYELADGLDNTKCACNIGLRDRSYDEDDFFPDTVAYVMLRRDKVTALCKGFGDLRWGRPEYLSDEAKDRTKHKHIYENRGTSSEELRCSLGLCAPKPEKVLA
jgi:hypothetical protein